MQGFSPWSRARQSNRMGAQKEEPRGQESEQALFGLVFISSLFIVNDITKGYIIDFQSTMLLVTLQWRARSHSRATSGRGGSSIAFENSATSSSSHRSSGKYNCVLLTGVSSAGSLPFPLLAPPVGPASEGERYEAGGER